MKHLLAVLVIAVAAFAISMLTMRLMPRIEGHASIAAAIAVAAYIAGVFAGRTTSLDAAVQQDSHKKSTAVAAPPTAAAPAPKPKQPAEPKRSEALNLLAALQRDARFVDFIKEDLTSVNDAQIGAAARGVHRDCGVILERMFALRPLLSETEGSRVEIGAAEDMGRYRLTGAVADKPPISGVLEHAGWEATRCDIPTWNGSSATARVVAPAEVQVG